MYVYYKVLGKKSTHKRLRIVRSLTGPAGGEGEGGKGGGVSKLPVRRRLEVNGNSIRKWSIMTTFGSNFSKVNVSWFYVAMSLDFLTLWAQQVF